ncbi:MAG: hypothetical protein AAFU80_08795 [Pseudomonadota bacterium]
MARQASQVEMGATGGTVAEVAMQRHATVLPLAEAEEVAELAEPAVQAETAGTEGTVAMAET